MTINLRVSIVETTFQKSVYICSSENKSQSLEGMNRLQPCAHSTLRPLINWLSVKRILRRVCLSFDKRHKTADTQHTVQKQIVLNQSNDDLNELFFSLMEYVCCVAKHVFDGPILHGNCQNGQLCV